MREESESFSLFSGSQGACAFINPYTVHEEVSMCKIGQVIGVFMLSGFVLLGGMPGTAVSAEPSSPATGYDIHVQAPHMMPDGTPGSALYHHYSKILR